jgi:hypothetical protein
MKSPKHFACQPVRRRWFGCNAGKTVTLGEFVRPLRDANQRSSGGNAHNVVKALISWDALCANAMQSVI